MINVHVLNLNIMIGIYTHVNLAIKIVYHVFIHHQIVLNVQVHNSQIKIDKNVQNVSPLVNHAQLLIYVLLVLMDMSKVMESVKHVILITVQNALIINVHNVKLDISKLKISNVKNVHLIVYNAILNNPVNNVIQTIIKFIYIMEFVNHALLLAYNAINPNVHNVLLLIIFLLRIVNLV